MSGRFWTQSCAVLLAADLSVAACGGKSDRSPHGEPAAPSAGRADASAGAPSALGGAASQPSGGAELGGAEASAGAPSELGGSGGEGGALDVPLEPRPWHVEDVAVGTDHACALLENGRVKCWGNNLVGQLGAGDKLARGLDPEQMSDALPFVDLGTGRTAVAIAAGYRSSCALLDDGSVKCWGNNPFAGKVATPEAIGDEPGEMGDALPSLPLPLPAPVVGLALGHFGACISLGNGMTWCGSRSAAPDFVPSAQDASLGNILGSSYVLGVYSDASARSIVAGSREPSLIASNVRLAAASVHFYCFAFNDGTGKCLGDHGFDVPHGLNQVRELSVTVDGVLCGMHGVGEVACWGNLPPGFDPPSPGEPRSVPIAHSVQRLAGGGDDFQCGITTERRVECWNWSPTPLAAVGNRTTGSQVLVAVALGNAPL